MRESLLRKIGVTLAKWPGVGYFQARKLAETGPQRKRLQVIGKYFMITR